MLRINDEIEIPLREFEFDFVRSSGPGGQNVNKVNTKAVMRWNICMSPSLPAQVRHRFMEKHKRRINQDGILVLTSQRFRDRGRNIADCLAKLQHLLVQVASPPKPRKPTRPSKASKAKRRRQKTALSEKKQRRRHSIRDE